MSNGFPKKIGYFTVSNEDGKYIVDSGKTIFLPKFNKTIINKNRILKNFKTYEGAVKFIKRQLSKHKKEKQKKTSKIIKSLYLVILKEKETNRLFVKVGFTSKKYIMGRFSKKFGYSDYELVTIVRRVYTTDAEKHEKDIKEKIKKNNIKKFSFLNEGFSGYSECFNYEYYEKVVSIFDAVTKKLL